VYTAPVITTAPTGATACEGTDASFSVAASGTGVSYQWQTDNGTGATWINLAGETTTDLILGSVPVSMNGYQYRVAINGTCGTTVTSLPVALTVNTAPSIGTQPTDIIICEGGNAGFSVTAGGADLSYQWQTDNGTGFMWSDIVGETNAFLDLGSVSAAVNGYRYRVQITGSCDPGLVSDVVLLTVNTAPTIGTQPVDITICEGNTAGFSVTAGGSDLSYQWQTDNGTGFLWSDIAGETNQTLDLGIAPVAISGYRYRVQITGSCDPAITSDAVLLTVNTAPAIGLQPADVTICEGSLAGFSVGATGSDLVYQWQTDNGTGFIWSDLGGETNATLNLGVTAMSLNGYRYRVQITGGCDPGITSDAVLLTVNTIPVIGVQPTDKAICEGSDANFTVTATGTDLAYQWQTDNGTGSTWGDIAGATNSNLFLAAVLSGKNGYRYRVHIAGTCGSAVISSPVLLTVNVLPVITTPPAAATVCAGTNVNFSAVVTGTGLTYQWQTDNGTGNTWSNIGGATTASLSLPTVIDAMNGYRYRIAVNGTCGSVIYSLPALLTVNVAPVIVTQPSGTAGCENTAASFTVTATGTNLVYQWQTDNGTGSTWSNITGAMNASLSLPAITASMNGYRYQVKVTGVCGSAVTSTPAILTVNILPVITGNPAAQSVCAGSNASFAVTATGTGLQYQWQTDNGTGSTWNNVLGAMNASLVFPAVNNTMNGYRYRTIVTGTCGSSLVSQPALLTVNAAPVITVQPVSASSCVASPASFSVTATGTGLTYQWQTDNGSGTNWVPVTSATNTSFTINSVTATMDGYRYRVVVANTCGGTVTSTPALLTVNAPATFSVQPVAASVCEGQSASFTAVATGTLIQYQWQTNHGSGWQNISNATNGSLLLSEVTPAMNNYSYRVLAGATCAAVNSSSAVLTVVSKPVVSAGTDTTIMLGDSAVLHGSVAGTGVYQYQWMPVLVTGIGNSNVLQPKVSPSEDTHYTLQVSGQGCSASASVWMRVQLPVVIAKTVSPNSDGTNDNWKIENLNHFPAAKVQVFNRYGQQLYTGDANSKPWDGCYQGKKVAVGTYYYVIDLKNGRKPLSGWLFIVH
jgi:gliding motility-associated-like protein